MVRSKGLGALAVVGLNMMSSVKTLGKGVLVAFGRQAAWRPWCRVLARVVKLLDGTEARVLGSGCRGLEHDCPLSRRLAGVLVAFEVVKSAWRPGASVGSCRQAA